MASGLAHWLGWADDSWDGWTEEDGAPEPETPPVVFFTPVAFWPDVSYVATEKKKRKRQDFRLLLIG